jgi:hypothetical protein
MTAGKNGGIFRFPSMRTKFYININDMESQMVINISEYSAAAMDSDIELQILMIQLKRMKKVQYMSNLMFLVPCISVKFNEVTN